MSRVLFVQKRFLSLAQIKESLEMALAAASVEFNVSLLFMDDGVCQLICPQDSDLSIFLTALPLYDIQKIYVAQESLDQRQFVPQDLILPAACLSRHEVSELLRGYRLVFC